MCPINPPNLIGSYDPDVTNDTMEKIEKRFENVTKSGGYYKPPDCQARDRVAIIAACRGEGCQRNIPVLMKNLHPMLM